VYKRQGQNRERLANDVITQYEALDSNTIRIYCNMKGTDYDPEFGNPAILDDKVTLTKDKLGFDAGEYRFEWRLKEIIPV